MARVYVGIDLASKTCTAASIDGRGKLIDSEEFKTSAKNIISFVSRQKSRPAVMIEECELAGWVYRTLLPYAQEVVVSDPRRNAWVSKAGRKSDSVDALKLAELLRLGSYSAVYHPEEEEMAAFKIAVQHYDRMVKTTVRLKSQIKARLRGQGVITAGKMVYGMRGREKVLSELAQPAVRDVLAQDYRLLDYLTRERAKARSLVVRLSGNFPVIERLQKIPGVGPVLAARFVAYVQNPHRFNKGTLASFSSLGVIKRESGGSPLGRERLDKSGNGSLKDLSRTAFNGAIKSRGENGIKAFYRRSYLRTGNADHARLNTQRKILAVMLAMWRDGTEYSDSTVTGKGA
jgi:transposase